MDCCEVADFRLKAIQRDVQVAAYGIQRNQLAHLLIRWSIKTISDTGFRVNILGLRLVPLEFLA
jgi:hypothetical protein